MLTGVPPYRDQEIYAALDLIVKNGTPVVHAPTPLEPRIKDFLDQCLARNPEDRASAAKLLDHALVKDVYGSSEILSQLVHKVQRKKRIEEW